MEYRRFSFFLIAAFICLPNFEFAAEEHYEYKYEPVCCERGIFYLLWDPTDYLDKKKVCLNGLRKLKDHNHYYKIEKNNSQFWGDIGLAVCGAENKDFFLIIPHCLAGCVEGRSPPIFEIFKLGAAVVLDSNL